MSDKEPLKIENSPGFWSQAWSRYKRRKLAMAALLFIVFLSGVAVFSPMIAGTKPIICKYKGSIYFPCMGYYYSGWENPIFQKDKFRRVYPRNLKQKDPDSWAIWPLVYQDPYRPVRANEWGLGEDGNPYDAQGSPSSLNLFGTYKTGFDIFASMVHGTRIALLVGFVSTGLSALIGICIGAIAGYLGGRIDITLSRFIEVVMCVPSLVLILALLAVVESPNIFHVMAVLGLTGWTGMARLTRAEFLKLRESEFVAAARCLGARPPRIMVRHILPNSLAPVLVPIAFGIAAAILVEAALSLLGFGISPPNPSWGTVLNSGREKLQSGYWWQLLFPGIAIFLTVLAYNLIGEGLQESTDPRLADPRD